MSSPDYIDPKKVKMHYVHDEIDTLLTRRSSADRVEDRRNALADKMLTELRKYEKQINNVAISEFKEYEVLFIQDTLDRYINGQMDANEAGQYEQLHIKYKQRFNQWDEIVVYDDYTKEEIYRLPKALSSLNIQRVQDDHILLDVVQNTSIQNSQISNILTERKHGEAVYNLARTINDTQDVSSIQKNNDRYHELATKLQETTGKQIPGAIANPKVTVNTNTSQSSTESEIADLLDSLF